jgi:crossover junction endodeoxyribonuclease RuvC
VTDWPTLAPEDRPFVIGLDLSLRATGLAYDGGALTIAPRTTGMRRLHEIAVAVLDVAEELPAALVVVEDYAYSRADAHAHELGELGGVVKLTLWLHDFEVVTIVSSSLKKYATGKGNAPKEQVLVAAGKRLGYEGHDHNQSDAMWLRAMALDHYGFPLCPMPAEQRAALDKIAWPKLAAPTVLSR